ncbi:MAG: DUF1284 domain-containing protein [Prevotella sp.]|nr:DUF1284 domain-containing protein [Alistipes senegalensis]MCM1358606.1 DUF1284 domain-containing protein [Prevotella sp.]MCM1473826.1 DUF1284 domain-containing protein [Muribaculaceae bacterium]
MSEYKLRPHHALCINFFEGKGYSNEFTENMTRIIENFRENPIIEITTGHDVICSKCTCTDCHDKALSYDMKVIDICGISGKISWKNLQKTIHEKIISAGKLKEICGNCQWFYICEKKGT